MSAVHGEFQAAIAALWARLGLAPPRFAEPDRVQLRVEGVSVDLFDNGRGSLVIEGVAGELSHDPALRVRQTRRILETNLGLLLDSEAGVYLAGSRNGQVDVAVRAAYPYAMERIERLMKKVEDTIRTMEYYSAELKFDAAAGARAHAAVSATSEPAVIFRP